MVLKAPTAVLDKETIALTIDGSRVEAPKGATVLQAALDAGIYIPTLCYDPDLTPYGGCRLCVVEIDGMRGLVSSCTTPAADGMVVHTETPRVSQSRRITMELIIANHHGDCLTCAKNQRCDLQKVARYLGIEEEHFGRLRRGTQLLPLDESNPFFTRDLNKCILCAKCTRACHEVAAVGAIDLAFRGYSAKVCTAGDKPIVESTCESCGECVVRCPTGALVPRQSRQATRQVKTICSYCGTGCSLFLGVRGNEVVEVQGDRESPVNRGSLCVKGRFGFGFINSSDRLTAPLIKKDGQFVKASWDEALDLVASKLSNYKGDQFAAVSSAKATNEENYVVQKFARAVMGTNNVDHCARL